MADIDRLKKLAGLPQALDPNEDQAERRMEAERYDRERKIKTAIALAFKKIGLTIADDEFGPKIIYGEDDRLAEVTVDDAEFELDQLMAAFTRLKASGLSDRYMIEMLDHQFDLKFVVSQALDGLLWKRSGP
jgi:hypothetical protein